MPPRLLLLVVSSWAVVVSERPAFGQALEPRSYVNTPTGVNFLVLGYGYTDGDVGLDEASPVKDTKVQVHAALFGYARSLDVAGRSGKLVVVLPVSEASGSAKVAGLGRDRQVLGIADPLLRVSVNLLGAPALSLKDFSGYRQNVIVGVSLQLTAPLGQYDSTKLLNLGTHRWTFKPEVGVSKAWDPITLEVILAATFFTTNDAFFGGMRLEQAPIYALQAHLIYACSRALWVALNTTYYAGGRTTINGQGGPEPENARIGLTTAFSLGVHQSIKLYGNSGAYARTANDFWALGIAWQYRWGGGL
jgi:hypothetical protein